MLLVWLMNNFAYEMEYIFNKAASCYFIKNAPIAGICSPIKIAKKSYFEEYLSNSVPEIRHQPVADLDLVTALIER